MSPNTHPPKTTQGQTKKPRVHGRAKGRPLSARQSGLVENLLPQIRVSLDADDLLAPVQNYTQTWLEVGFGGAEHLLHHAKLYPDVALIGVEPFLNGVAKALTGIDDTKDSRAPISNILLHHGDARDVMAALPDASLSKIFVLFPDPWPKSRHFKRRILSAEFIADIYKLLKPGGAFRFASDIISYVDWTLERVDAFQGADGKGFIWQPKSAQDWRNPPDDWPGTRYEAKAFREGRKCHYFEFFKPV